MTPVKTFDISNKTLFQTFLHIGSTGFGGPIALLGLIEQKCVQENKWIVPKDFQQIVAVSKLCPGPLATLVGIRIGFRMGGIVGGILAGIGLIIPAFLMILLLAWFFENRIETVRARPLFSGLAIGALAISLLGLYRLSKPLWTDRQLPIPTLIIVFGLNTLLTFFDPAHEIFFLLASGAIGLIWERYPLRFRPREFTSSLIFISLTWVCFKASWITFGSGIAMIPILKSIFVNQNLWVTENDFLVALSIGQITPGPMVITASYLGFQVASFWGAVATTVGTFLPSFLLGVWILPKAERHWIDRPFVKTFFRWMLPAICGAILGSLINLSAFSIQGDPFRFLIFLVAIIGTFRTWLPSTLLIIASGLCAEVIALIFNYR